MAQQFYKPWFTILVLVGLLTSTRSNGLEPKGAEYYEKTAWRLDYIQEQDYGSPILVDDVSMDQRLANIITTANSIKLVQLDLHRFNSGSQEMDTKLRRQVAGSRVSDKLCGEHLRSMLRQMDEMDQILERKRQGDLMAFYEKKHKYLERVLDSFGQYESGQLLGKTHLGGSFFQCDGRKLMLNNESSSFSTRFCWAKLRLDKHLNSTLRVFKEEAQISMAFCIPESCHSLHSEKYHHLLQRLVNRKFRLPKSSFVDEFLPLESVFCAPDVDGEFGIPTSGRMLCALLVGWFALVAYATVRCGKTNQDERRQGSRLDKIFNALSLQRSWSVFTCETDDKNKSSLVNLDIVNPVKCLSSSYVVLGHSSLIIVGLSQDVLRAYKSIENDPSLYFIIGGTVAIDSFYVVSGLVLTYIALKRLGSGQRAKRMNSNDGNDNLKSTEVLSQEMKKKQSSGLVDFLLKSLGFTLNRYLRLVPLFYLAFWFKKSVLINMTGLGPIWDNGFNKDTISGGCRQESWWSPITFGAAYLPVSSQCLPQTWSVATDLFGAIILGPIVVGYTRRPRLALGAALLISLISCIWLYATLSDIPSQVMILVRNLNMAGVAETFRNHSYIYSLPYLRCYGVLIGSMAGYLLYRYEQGGKLADWPEWFKGRATRYALITIAHTLLSPPLAVLLKRTGILNKYPVHVWVRLVDVSMTVGRYSWSVANAILFLRMATDWRGNFLMRFFASKFWQILVRVNYAVILIHLDILLTYAQMHVTTVSFTKYNVLTLFTSAYLLSLALGVIVFVFIECPINQIVKIFFHFGGTAGTVKQNIKSQ